MQYVTLTTGGRALALTETDPPLLMEIDPSKLARVDLTTA